MKNYSSDLPKIEEFVRLSGKSLLEIGCGDGRLTTLLANKAREITAIDPDESSIETARTTIPGVNFSVGSGENLDLADNLFDIVLFSYSLHHQDCVKALAEAHRVVRRDGQILIIEPTHDGEFTRLVSIFEPLEVSILSRTFTYITSGSFRILRRDTYGVDHPFTDEKELYNYFIMEFSTGHDDGSIEKMQALIGSKKSNRPIIIQDVVNIFLLGK